MRIADILNNLQEKQRNDLYYVVGYALNNGREKTVRLAKYKELIKSFDNIQRKTLKFLIDEATKEKIEE